MCVSACVCMHACMRACVCVHTQVYVSIWNGEGEGVMLDDKCCALRPYIIIIISQRLISSLARQCDSSAACWLSSETATKCQLKQPSVQTTKCTHKLNCSVRWEILLCQLLELGRNEPHSHRQSRETANKSTQMYLAPKAV